MLLTDGFHIEEAEFNKRNLCLRFDARTPRLAFMFFKQDCHRQEAKCENCPKQSLGSVLKGQQCNPFNPGIVIFFN